MKRRALAASLAALLLAPAAAHADPFGELAFRPVRGIATCVQATGAAGELARWTNMGVELFQADGLARVEQVRVGGALGCPVVRSAPNGAAVAAAAVRRTTTVVVRVAVREPGGRFGAPVALTIPEAAPNLSLVRIAAAISPRGDAVVAVAQGDAESGPVPRSRVLVFRRPPGGAFGEAEQLAPWSRAEVSAVEAGAAADGGLTLAWLQGSLGPAGASIEAASAPPGGAFGGVQRVGPAAGAPDGPALAVAPDGRALLAYASLASGVTVAERAPGAASFGAPAPVAPRTDTAFTAPALALAADGAAVVAWQPFGPSPCGVRASSRLAGGAFGPARDVSKGAAPIRRNSGWSSFILVSGDTPVDGAPLRAALTGAGFVLSWADDPANCRGDAPRAATGALAGGAITPASLSPGVRPAISLAPLALPDDRAAVAWADDATIYGNFPTGHGRLHLSVAGAAGAAGAPAPMPAVGRLARQRLFADQALVIPVRCASACDVRAVLGNASSTSTLDRAGELRLRLQPLGAPLIARDARFAEVTLRAAAPGSRAVSVRRVRVPLTLRPSPPVPKPLGVRVRRRGDDLVVSWRTAFGAHRVLFYAVAESPGGAPVATAVRRARGRRTFTVTLRHARGARAVTVAAQGVEDQRRTRVRVR